MKQNALRVLANACVFLPLSLALAGCGGGSNSITGCGSNCPPLSKPEFLYAGSLNQIVIFSVNPTTGALGSPTAIAGPNVLDGIVATPAATFLYVSDFQADAIDAFSINASTGALTPVGSPTPIGPGPNGGGGLATDPAGKFLYATDLNANVIAVFTINSSTGALTAVGSPVPTGAEPVQPVVDLSGKFLYVTDNNDPNGGISAYTINSASGALTPVLGSPFPTQIATSPGPAVPVVSPDGKFLFVTLLGRVNYNQFVASLAIDPNTGALSSVAGSPFPSGIGPLGAAVDPAGKFLYTANDGDGTLSSFAINGTSGALAPVNGSPFPAGTNLSGLVIDPTGKFLYTTNPLSNDILILSTDSTGSISPVGQPVTAGQQPHLLALVKVP
jgi:6-phosphogluconolactonase